MRLILSLTLFLTHFISYSKPEVSFTLSMPEPHTHYFEVKMDISNVKSDSLLLKMPVWSPGSYLIREFSKHVEAFSVKDSKNKAIAHNKISKNTWLILTKGNSDFTINYKVYANELTVRTSFLDADHGYLNGTSIFLYPKGHKDIPIALTIIPYKGWETVSTQLKRTSKKEWTYEAPDYDYLYDSPIEIGNHKVLDFFSSEGIPHKIALFGNGNFDEAKLIKDMTKVVDVCTQVYGENPCDAYTFIVHNLDAGRGGLEHLHSTTLQVERWTYTPGKPYKGYISLAAHEYFHLWNVKRMRPKALGPFDYDQENYTNLLWVMEGFTSYYDELLLRRANFYTDEEYLKVFAGSITSIENQPGNKVQPVADASYDAWIKAYRPNENSANTTISYYTKGSILAFLLDLEIINATQGEKTLDDLMQHLYQEYYKKQDRGFTDQEMQQAVEKVAGKNMNDFFQSYVYDTVSINYNHYLNYVGYKLMDIYDGVEKPILGVSTSGGSTVTVNSVVRGSAAYKGGINAFDEIIAIDGYRVNKAKFDQIISEKSAGDEVEVLISRDGLLKTFNITLENRKKVNYRIVDIDNPSESQLHLRAKWLKSTL